MTIFYEEVTYIVFKTFISHFICVTSGNLFFKISSVAINFILSSLSSQRVTELSLRSNKICYDSLFGNFFPFFKAKAEADHFVKFVPRDQLFFIYQP